MKSFARNLTFWMGVYFLVKTISGFALYKWIGISIGDQYIPIFGQALSIFALFALLSSGGLGRGLVYYSLEQSGEADRDEIRSGVKSVLIVLSITLSMLLLTFSEQVSSYVFGSENFRLIVVALCAVMPLLAMNNLAFSIASISSSKIKFYVLICLSIIASVVVVYLGHDYYSSTVLYYPAIQALITAGFLVVFLRKMLMPYLKARLWGRLREVKLLINYSSSIFASVFLSLGAMIYVRSVIIVSFDSADAAMWEILTRVSEGYIQFFGLVLAYKLFPLLILNKSSSLTRIFIRVGAAFIGLVFGIIVFIDGFMLFMLPGVECSSVVLALLIVLGDFFRVLISVLQHIFLASNNLKRFTFFELIWVALLCLSTSLFGFHGLYEYAICYLITFLFVFLLLFIYQRTLFKSVGGDPRFESASAS